MNFEKKTLSKRVGKFLEENIQDQEEKESVRKIMQGRKLQYLAANKLILTLITAMVMGDGEEDGEDEVQDAGEGQDGQTQPQTQTQASTSSQEPQDGTQSQRSEKPDFSRVLQVLQEWGLQIWYKLPTGTPQVLQEICQTWTAETQPIRLRQQVW